VDKYFAIFAAVTRWKMLWKPPPREVEKIFDRIDNKFIDFYGEYGQKNVNTQ